MSFLNRSPINHVAAEVHLETCDTLVSTAGEWVSRLCHDAGNVHLLTHIDDEPLVGVITPRRPCLRRIEHRVIVTTRWSAHSMSRHGVH